MRVWSSVRSGLLFSHWMYFFHISTCWASWGEFCGGTEGAFLSSPFITVSYSWMAQTGAKPSAYISEDGAKMEKGGPRTFATVSPWPLSWHSCSPYFGPRSSFWPGEHWFPVGERDGSVQPSHALTASPVETVYKRPGRLTHLLVFAIISPELLDVDHRVDAASLVDPPHRSDALVLCVWAHSFTDGPHSSTKSKLRVG